MSKSYRLFISHSWNYSDAYDKVNKLLKNQNINYYNHSVPKNNPIHTNGTDKQLKAEIESKIKGTSCVLILAGVYSTYSKWIKKEIDIANLYGKPIIAIEPWGSKNTSVIVKNNADKIVSWQGKSIVSAIKELCN
ncbi:TIR domain-containing protein [Clostridium sp. 'deep sea']|uniref:TIR domain-containing protein n=1 Tax=Clostridium sp. 'deep sea' TaxID=2779445 RepID=UPI0018969C29|nr:TIR domain-containing protein [Clostridium sp. 'deep sea']QOR35068.1 TIR domain-containing protein [Clostridium sp. 'deep sea']